MKKAIVTTTINNPTTALLKFISIAERDDWNVYIVGDKKTPHEEHLKLAQAYPHVAYVTPEIQERKYKKLSDLIGWNCIQRRNFGFLEALRNGAEIIATVDDDNIPYENWGQNLAIGSQSPMAIVQCQDMIFDPLSATRHSDLWHRGFPTELLAKRHRATFLTNAARARTLVQADFWDGEPDVDAICRIAKGPFDCKFEHPRFAATAPGPFNSQNTFLHKDCFPDYFLFPHIGRMDDIWASYVLQAKFPDTVVYGQASVYQERNDHNLVNDLKAEMIGYENTLELCRKLFLERGEGTLEGYLPPKALKAYIEFQELVNNL